MIESKELLKELEAQIEIAQRKIAKDGDYDSYEEGFNNGVMMALQSISIKILESALKEK